MQRVLVADSTATVGRHMTPIYTEFVDAFYRIGQESSQQIVILTGAGGDHTTSLGHLWRRRRSGVGAKFMMKVQVLENIPTTLPVIAAIEGRHVHSDTATCSVIVAAEAQPSRLAHFAAGMPR